MNRNLTYLILGKVCQNWTPTLFSPLRNVCRFDHKTITDKMETIFENKNDSTIFLFKKGTQKARLVPKEFSTTHPESSVNGKFTYRG